MITGLAFMTQLLYSLSLALLSPLILLYLYAIRGNKQSAYRQNFLERLGIYSTEIPKHAVVFHCASVGEVLAATPLIKTFIQQNPLENILVTCNSPTGRVQIEQNLGNTVTVCYLPIDFYFSSKRFIHHVQPKLLVMLETELWPNLFAHARQLNCPINIINARLSEKSFLGYQKIAPLSRFIMQHINTLASHNDEDAQRFIRLGLEPHKVMVTGSIKFDIQLTKHDKNTANQLKQTFSERPIWVAGSTHPGEHEQILAAHQILLNTHPSALLIIAPRHPEQFNKVEALLTQSPLQHCRRSSTFDPKSQVLLADTLGELKMLFGCADIAYIGGSLIERGGHNPLEAAAFSLPILTGPHVYNFAHIYPLLFELNAATKVSNSQELASLLNTLLNDEPQRKTQGKQALACLARNQGAITKTLNLLQSQLKTTEQS